MKIKLSSPHLPISNPSRAALSSFLNKCFTIRLPSGIILTPPRGDLTGCTQRVGPRCTINQTRIKQRTYELLILCLHRMLFNIGWGKAMSKAKSVVKTFGKQTRPYNDIQISGWLLSVMACIAHVQPGGGKRREWCGRFEEKFPQIFLTEAPSHHIFPFYSPCGCQEGTDSSS